MNLSFTAFAQGEHRMVVVIDGLEHIPTEQEQINAYFQSLLGGIASSTVNSAPSADVKHLGTDYHKDLDPAIIDAVSKKAPAPTTPTPSIPVTSPNETTTAESIVFKDGQYAGKTPSEVLSTGTTKDQRLAMQYLSKAISEASLDVSIMDAVKEALNLYLKNRFKEIADPHAYAEKLTEKQAYVFLQQFKDAIPSDIKAVVKDWDTLLVQGPIDTIREIIEKSTLYFQNLN